ADRQRHVQEGPRQVGLVVRGRGHQVGDQPGLLSQNEVSVSSSPEAPPSEEAPVDTTPIKAVPVRHYGRWVAGAIILFVAFIVIRSVITNDALQWPVVGDYLFDDRILRGLQNTLILTVISMLIGIVGGVLLAVMRLSPNPLTSGAAAVYIWLFRGTPLITQLIIWNFLALAYPRLGLGIPFGPEFVSWDTNQLIT